MEQLTVGDIRAFLDLAASNPLLDNDEAIASQLRSLLTAQGVPITAEIDQALTIIEQNPALVGVGVEEFRSAVDGLPDDTLLSDVPAFTSGNPVVVTPETDANGNLVQNYTLPFSGTTITVDGDTVTVTGDGINEQLIGVERLDFDDGTLFFDVAEEPGLVYAGYETIIGSPPNTGIVNEWLIDLEGGDADAFDFAEELVANGAFDSRFGSIVDDSAALVTRFFQDFYGRDPLAAGLEFWSGFIDANGGVDAVDDALGYFLIAEELGAVLESTFANGIFVTDVDMV